MLNQFLKLNSLLIVREKIILIFFIFLIILESVLEIMTISLIFPILTYMTNDQYFSDIVLFNEYLSKILSLSPYIISLTLIMFFIIKSIVIIIIRKFYLDFCISVSQRISYDIFNYTFNQSLLNFQNNDNSEYIRNLQIIPIHFQKVLMGLITIFSELIIIGCIFLFILYYSSLLSLSSLIPFLISLSIYYAITRKKLDRISNESFALPSELIKIIKNSIDNFLEIKILNNSKIFLSKFLEKQFNFLKVNRNLALLQLFPRYVIEISLLTFLILSYFIIFNFGSGKNDIITFFSLIIISSYKFIPSINKIFTFIQNLKFYKPAISKLYEWSTEIPKENIKQKENNYNFKSISIKNLSFYYKNKMIINNLNFQINSGDKILIYGSSGSGKTTFLKIISGLYNPTDGLIDYKYKINIVKPTPIYLSKKFIYIPQNSYLFDGSILQNITLNFSSLINVKTKKKVMKTIKEFNLNEYFNNFSNGLDTVIHSNSSMISGGQKQIISIVRALFNNPKFLVLDETLNALNNELQFNIIKKLLNKDITIILISHNSNMKKYFRTIYEFKKNNLKIVR